MHVSVVVPTLNGRERLDRALDALTDHAPEAEVVVVNGPSTDGTTGMVRARDDVDVLVEVSTRTLDVARNAGARASSGDVVAFLAEDLVVDAEWLDAVVETFETTDADAVTGPSRRRLRAGVTAEEPETGGLGDREVTYFDGGNVAFRADALRAIDGFDEYLETGGARDAAHRLVGLDREVVWADGMSASREYGWQFSARSFQNRYRSDSGPRSGGPRRAPRSRRPPRGVRLPGSVRGGPSS